MTESETVDAQRWLRIESILDRLLDLRGDPAQQALLNELCGDDPALRGEIEELLEAVECDSGLLETRLSEAAPELLRGLEASLGEELEAIAGRRIGAYRLVDVLGRGGMGVVYLAERADRQFEKRVAIKLMPRGLETEEMEHRFLIERQILASLEHPHIARLIDGQLTEDGFPYLVMEYVEGRAIDAYCTEEQLDLRTRLGLFLDVCAAVQYAHENLVIHRDLKPNNLLVTQDGVVKLLDFGIAKLLDPTATELAQGLTVYQPRTPQYASPEQIANRPVWSASDVYSLGVILYELLTGQTPYELAGLSDGEIEAVVTARQTQAPSRVVDEHSASSLRLDLKRLRRRLSGDLDTIVLKALRKDPGRRYRSAAELGADILRCLEGRPIAARPSTLAYKARKFVGRHELGVASAAAIVLLMIVGVLVIAWQGRVAARERDRAQLEARKAAKVAEFLGSLFEAANPSTSGAGQVSVRELLDIGEIRIDQELESEPEVRSEMLVIMSDAYGELGDIERAIALGEQAIRDLRPLGIEAEETLAKALTAVGGNYHGKGDYVTAERLLDEALELLERNNLLETRAAAQTWRLRGLVQTSTGRPLAAEASHEEALRLWRSLGLDEHAAGELSNLATALDHQGRAEESFELEQQALQELTTIYGEEHPVVSTARNNLAIALHRRGEFTEAETLYRTALAINVRALGPDHSSVADNLTNLGKLYIDQGRYREAEPHIRRAVELRHRTDEPSSFHRIATEINLATLLRRMGEWRESEELYRLALVQFEHLLGTQHLATVRVQSLLGQLLSEQGRSGEAAVLLEAALETQRSIGAESLHLSETLLALGEVECDRGRAASAEPLLREALELRLAILEADDWQVGEARAELGGALLQLGKSEEGRRLLEGGIQILAASRPDSDRQLQRARQLLAETDP